MEDEDDTNEKKANLANTKFSEGLSDIYIKKEESFK